MYYFPIVYLLLSIDIEALLGENILTDLLPLAALGLGVARFAFIDRQQLYIGSHWNKKNVTLYFLSFLVFIIAVARVNSEKLAGGLGYITLQLKYVLFSLFIYLFISYQFRNNNGFEKNVQRILYVFFLTITIEAAFYFVLYVTMYGRAEAPPDGGEAHLVLGMLGVYYEKRLMPIVNAHPNTMGIYVGGVVTMALLLIRQKGIGKQLKKLLWIFIGVGGLFLLLVDSRGTIINTVMASLGVYLLSRTRFLGALRIMPILTPLLPFIMLAVLTFIAESGLGSQVSRAEGDLATGNNRSAIWEECVKELSEPKLNHFIGYGAMGHYAAGVSQKYSWIFGTGETANSMVTHNYFFQMVFDMGYFGTLIFFTFLFIVLTNAVRMYRNGYTRSLAVIGFLVYFMLSGTSESVYGIYNKSYYMVFTTVVLFMVLSYNEYTKSRTELTPERELKFS